MYFISQVITYTGLQECNNIGGKYNYVCKTSLKLTSLLHLTALRKLKVGGGDHLELVNQCTKTSLRMWLGKNICKLILRGDRKRLKSTMDKMMTNKITINLDVFNPFMKDIVVSNLNGTPIITIKKSGRRCECT